MGDAHPGRGANKRQYDLSRTGRAVLDVVLTQPPDLNTDAVNIKGGNPRRPRQRTSVGQRRRPPRIFSSRARVLTIRGMLSLEGNGRAGAIGGLVVDRAFKAPPKAGVGIQGPRQTTATQE